MPHVDSPIFAQLVIAWQQQFGRHHLPWQGGGDAYAIWVSEIMLQQTQVKTVLNYYPRFMTRFPTVMTLANATFEDVASVWSGLGYYARARNLHKGAQQVCRDFAGVVPTQVEQLMTLAGIGRSTAAAIAVFSVGADAAILDGNVKRVLARYFTIDGVGAHLEKKLWPLAEVLLPLSSQTAQDATENTWVKKAAIKTYTQGLMDLGATVCTRSRPKCSECPLSNNCVAAQGGTQSSYPNRAIKKILPHKAAQFLLLRFDDQVLLETRIDQGIWGGMMALPQLTDFIEQSRFMAVDFAKVGAELALTRAQSFAKAPLKIVQCWPKFTHKFTHFSLDIYLIEVRAVQALAFRFDDSASTRWWPLNQISEAPLPAPLKQRLQKF